MTTTLAAKIARDYGTPAVAIDMDRVERNIARIQAACDAVGVADRPHIKTHKSPFLARLQRDAGAKGITCQKLGEAEVMVDGGLDNILISYNLLGEEKMQRLGSLMRRATITVTADNPVVLSQLPQAAEGAGRPVPVVIECDTGRKRAGVETPGEAIALVKEIMARRKDLTFAGFLMYPTESGWPEAQRFLDEAIAGTRSFGVEPSIISTGGSPNLKNLGKLNGATEHRPGTYIYNDRMQVAAGVAGRDDCALYVYSTVVSRAGADRGILDAGSKTLTSDTGGLEGHGFILEHPEARIARFAEEHGFLDLSRSNTRPLVGDVVRIVPNHVCVVVNMVDEVLMVRGEEIVGTLQVACRGKLR